MPDEAVTVTLPEPLYRRVRETAEISARPIEEVLTYSIALSLPPLEEDLPPEVRSELAALPRLSDAELQRLSKRSMDDERQHRLEALAELQKSRPLTPQEQSALDQLMDEAQLVMLRRAEVFRLLAHRGHQVFGSSVATDG